MSTLFLPKQRVSNAEKRKDDYAWAKKTAKEIIDSAHFGSFEDIKMSKLYKAYNGTLDQSDYKYVTDPYKFKDGNTRKLPARIRNYNIIKPVVDLLIGEKSKRPASYSVLNVSPDAVNIAQENKRKMIKTYLTQMLINLANEEGVDTGQEPYDTTQLEKQIRNFNETYKDALAIEGQEALEYLKYDLDLNDELLLGLFDFIVGGMVVSYKSVSYGNVEYEICNLDDIDFDKSSTAKYIQDGSWVVRRSRLTLNDIIDKFWDKLTPQDIDDLEAGIVEHGDNWLSSLLTGKDTPRTSYPVYHVTWKTLTEILFVDTFDELGRPITLEVTEDYKPMEGETVERYWVNEVWECYRIGNNKYLGMGPVPGQRSKIDHPSKCKLPYNGRIYSDRNAPMISVVSIGLPYQILYNIFHYRLELSIAKNKDKIALMEMNTIPKRHGWDEERFMYHADANGWAFVDSTATSKTGQQVNFNQWSVLDLSLGHYISAQFELLGAIKAEWEQLMGITPQRLGDIKSSAGKGITERAVFQSAVISEELFRRYEAFEQSEHQGLLDLSQIAWVDGKKGMYINSEGKNAILNINPETYPYSELGVFAWYSTEEKDKLEALRNLSLEFAQNGAKPSTVAEILDAKNFAKIKTLLKEVELRQEEYEKAQQQAEQEHAARIEKMRIEDREDQQELLIDLKTRELDNKIELKLLDLEAKGLEDNGVADKALDETKRSNRAKEDIEREKIRVQREALDVQERIARISARKSKTT